MFLGGSELVKAAIDMSTAALGPLWRCGLCHFPLLILLGVTMEAAM
jgi:hypothetical protein